MKRAAIALFGVVTMGIACPALAANFEIAPAPDPSIQVGYRDGFAGLESRKTATSVLIVIPKSIIDEKSRPTLVLALENDSGQPINLLASSIEVVTQSNRIVRVLTKDELVAEVSKSANGRAKLVGFLAALGAAGAGESSATSYTSGSIARAGALGSNFNATTTTEYRDPAAAAAAQAQAQRTIATARARAEAEIAEAGRGGFRAQTVETGTNYATPMNLEPLPRDTTTLTVKVTVGNDVHVIPISVTRR